MSRDHRKLRVFHDAHRLTLDIYQHTRDFPRDEWFGLRMQMRRAAVSIASNLVEGSARGSTRDYARFLHISLGSACELKYLAALTLELGYVKKPQWADVLTRCDAVVRQLERLIQGLEKAASHEAKESRTGAEPEREPRTPGARSLKPEACSPMPPEYHRTTCPA